MKTSKKIILASNSPRRRELLGGLDIDFEVRVKDGICEDYPQHLPMEEIPQYISREKSEAYDLAPDELLITADTIVWTDGRVLGNNLKMRGYEESWLLKQLNSYGLKSPRQAFLMTVETTSLFYDIVPDGGSIDLCYRVTIENTQAGMIEYHMDIRAK